MSSSAESTYASLFARLSSQTSPLLPPDSPLDASLTDSISSLRVHPALEAGLHILNHDLWSAHFLCRHMQSPPAYEGMFLHGILHRIEGDYDNARAWYSDVAESDVFRAAWGGGTAGKAEKNEAEVGADKNKDERLEKALAFIAEIEELKKNGKSGSSGRSKEELQAQSGREIRAVLDFSADKYGTGKVEDATQCWVRPDEKIKQIGEDMVSGDKGQRDF